MERRVEEQENLEVHRTPPGVPHCKMAITIVYSGWVGIKRENPRKCLARSWAHGNAQKCPWGNRSKGPRGPGGWAVDAWFCVIPDSSCGRTSAGARGTFAGQSEVPAGGR